MPTYILGISCFYHDSAAALVCDGRLVAAAEEERFSRKKHSHDFPEHAIKYCLEEAGISIDQVDYVGFYEKPMQKFERILTSYITTFPKSYKAFLKAIPLWMKEKLYIRKILQKKLGYNKEIVFSEHHMAHACSSFLVSPFEKAAVLTVDGVGEWGTTTYGFGEGNKIEIFKEIRYPHSLGLLYSAITGYLGFKVNDGEGKVMGLAPYGEPVYMKQMDELLTVAEDGSFNLNMKYFSFHYSTELMHNEKLCQLFGEPARIPGAEMTKHYENVAASLQKKLEDVLVVIAQNLYEKTKVPNLCMAGGVALNSVANWQIRQRTPFKNIFIQPAAGDDGAAIGTCYYIWNLILGNPRNFQLDHAFWGPEYSDEVIQKFLDENKVKYRKLHREELLRETAKLIADSKVVGWFQGRMEIGPRALGGRSILGNPRNPDMKDILNRKVKHREGFRPFAPTVTIENNDQYFDMDCGSPYMLLIGDVKAHARDLLPAITHVDGTARVQTVARHENPLYYDLVTEVGKLTGVPVVIDTSFNIAGEPIVCTPYDAYNCYKTTGIEYLVMGSFILEPKTPEEQAIADRMEKERLESHRKQTEELSEKARKGQKGFTKNAAFSIIFILLLFGIGEITCRLYEGLRHGDWSLSKLAAAERETPYKPHPFLGFSLVPGDYHTKKYNLTINNAGFRGKDILSNKDQGAFRIACIGASTTFGTGVDREESNWPVLLEQKLQSNFPDRQIEVINAGVAGYTTAECLMNLNLKVLDLKPDLVFFYEAYNDLKPNRAPNFKPDFSHWAKTYQTQLQEPGLVRSALLHSALYLKVTKEIGRVRQKARNNLWKKLPKANSVEDEGVRVYRRNVESMILCTRAHGIKIMLGTFVHCLRDDLPQKRQEEIAAPDAIFFNHLSVDGIKDGIKRHNQEIRSLADEYEVPLCDLAVKYPVPANPESEFKDDIHFNDKGCQVLADLIFHGIAETGFLKEN